MNDWFEVTEDLWRQPGSKRPSLRLLADENVPAELVADVREAGINCLTAESAGVGHRQDEDVLERATRLDRVLLTSDRRSDWIDRKPLNARKAGVIIIPAEAGAGRRALGLVLGPFALSFGRWQGATVLASEQEFLLVSRDPSGARIRYRLRLQAGRLMAHEESADSA